MLKQIADGLSRVWKPRKTHEPFYRGDKAEVSINEGILACQESGNVTFLDWDSGDVIGKLLESIEDEDESIEAVSCFCLHPNNEEIVVATKSNLLRHFDVKEKKCIRVFKGHLMPVLAMDYDNTGTLVVTGSADRTVRVWDIPRGYCTHSFRDHSDIVHCVKFHPDPRRLQVFSSSADLSVKVYNLTDQSSSSKCSFDEHASMPTALAVSPKGNILASCGRDKVNIKRYH